MRMRVTVAIGRNTRRWDEVEFETELNYDQCLEESVLLAEMTEKLNLGDDVAFVHMTHYQGDDE